MESSQNGLDGYTLIRAIHKLINGLTEEKKLALLKQVLPCEVDSYLLKLVLEMPPHQQLALLHQLEGINIEKEEPPENVVEVNVDERICQRKPLSVTAELIIADDCYLEQLIDISIGGAFIRTDNIIELGKEIDLAFSLPNSEEAVSLRAKIVRCTETGIGVKFLHLKPGEYHVIKKFLEDMEKL